MPRYARQIDPTALLEELIAYLSPRMLAEEICEQEDLDDWDAETVLYHGFSECTVKAYNDICKIDFSLENMSIDPKSGFSMEHSEKWLGPQKFGDLSVIGVLAGGDWEDPVAFVIYHDGKDFRAYVPRDGNSYDLKTKQAGGNDVSQTRVFDIDAMKTDVMKRIQIR